LYRIIRIIHLIAGLLTAPVLFMYSLSAIQMGHHTWFRLAPAVREQRFSSDMDCHDPRALAASLMASQAWRGELGNIHATAGGCSFGIDTLGTWREIQYNAATRSLLVRTSELPAMALLNRMHHAAGLWHPSGVFRMWAAVVALAAVACAALAGTGIWLWLLRKRERTIGLVLVTANLLFSIVILILLRSG